MIKLPRGALVLEVFASAMSLCFMRASAALGLTYFAVPVADNFVVDVDGVLRLLREQLKLPPPLAARAG